MAQKILIFSSSYPPILGGLQTIVSTLAKHLIEQGHTVAVITNRYPRNLPAHEVIDGVSVYRRLFLQKPGDYVNNPKLLAASMWFNLATMAWLTKFVRGFQPDVVNIHFPDAQAAYVLALRKTVSFRLIVSLHGDDIERYFVLKSHYEIPETREISAEAVSKSGTLRQILCEADAVTACSTFLLRLSARLEQSVNQKGYPIHNGVDLARFDTKYDCDHQNPYVCGIGRLIYNKGFDLLVAGFALICADYPDSNLLIAGEGEERPAIEKQIAELQMQDRIRLVGRVSQEGVVKLLKGASVAVVPSRMESFGIAALEVIAAGCPLVATKVGGLPEAIQLANAPEEMVRMVEPDVESIGHGLVEMLAMSNLPPDKRGLCGSVPMDISWTSALAKYENVLIGSSH